MEDFESIEGYARKINNLWVMWPYENWNVVKKPYLPHYLEFANEKDQSIFRQCSYGAKSIALSVTGTVSEERKHGMDGTIIVSSIISMTGGKYCSL